MNTAFLLSLVLIFAALVEFFNKSKRKQDIHRLFGLFISALTLLIIFYAKEVNIVGNNLEHGFFNILDLKNCKVFSVAIVLTFVAGIFFAPRAPLVRVDMSRVYFMQLLVLLLTQVTDLSQFLLLAIVLSVLLIYSLYLHAYSLPEDSRGKLRADVFLLYRAVAIILMLICLAFRFLYSFSPELGQIDIALLCLASAIVFGLFPFHAWVLPTLGTPRTTIFLPMFCIELALLFFFRIYSPLVSTYANSSLLFFILPLIGILYTAIAFFSERRLKRIPGYLYLNHINLMALSVRGLGEHGQHVSLLDGLNLLIASLGLISVCALLTARFGVKGVNLPTGLGSQFPAIAVCYLVCVLSLVGFPGTIGFVQEEVFLGQGVESHLYLVFIVAIALTLNGFSGFRLFARIFYGPASETKDNEISLLLREKTVLYLILICIAVNGLFPSAMVKMISG